MLQKLCWDLCLLLLSEDSAKENVAARGRREVCWLFNHSLLLHTDMKKTFVINRWLCGRGMREGGMFYTLNVSWIVICTLRICFRFLSFVVKKKTWRDMKILTWKVLCGQGASPFWDYFQWLFLLWKSFCSPALLFFYQIYFWNVSKHLFNTNLIRVSFFCLKGGYPTCDWQLTCPGCTLLPAHCQLTSAPVPVTLQRISGHR